MPTVLGLMNWSYTTGFYGQDIFSPGYKGQLDRFTSHHTSAIVSGAWRPNASDKQRINDLYDGAVNQADAMVGGIYEYLSHHGLIDDTIFGVFGARFASSSSLRA